METSAKRVVIGNKYLGKENVKLPTNIKLRIIAKTISFLNFKSLLSSNAKAPNKIINGDTIILRKCKSKLAPTLKYPFIPRTKLFVSGGGLPASKLP